MKKSISILLLSALLAFGSASAFAWSGTDSQNRQIEIDKRQSLMQGKTITVEIDGKEHEVLIDDIVWQEDGVEIDTLDNDTSESNHIKMGPPPKSARMSRWH